MIQVICDISGEQVEFDEELWGAARLHCGQGGRRGSRSFQGRDYRLGLRDETLISKKRDFARKSAYP